LCIMLFKVVQVSGSSNAAASWPDVRLGSLLTPRSSRGGQHLPLLSVVRERGVILRDVGSKEANHNFIPDDLSNYKVVDAGQLVINKMKAWSGSLGIAGQAGIVSPAYFVYDVTFENKRYAHFLFRSRTFVDEFARCSGGVRVGQWDLNIPAMKGIRVRVPSVEEQGLIVRYLDHAELRIARAIAAKTELARLLQQQRLALLCSEVLGRDEVADKTRDFGQLAEGRVLDWVGPVPENWDVVPLSGVFDVVKQKNIGLIENTVLSLSYGRVVIKPTEKLRGLVPESFETYQLIEPGDVIVRPTDLQNDTTSLRIGQARDRGIITSAYIALRPKKHVDPDYVMMQLAAYDFLKVLYGFGSGLRQNLDFKHLKHVPMMLPSLAEQSARVSRVRAKTESVEQAHAAILQEIALLKEYRTRLISDVVTGKLDVREGAVKLPEIDPMELATVSVSENGDDEETTDDD